jgi:hypothetical protein
MPDFREGMGAERELVDARQIQPQGTIASRRFRNHDMRQGAHFLQGLGVEKLVQPQAERFGQFAPISVMQQLLVVAFLPQLIAGEYDFHLINL